MAGKEEQTESIPTPARLLPYRVQRWVKSVTTYITAVAERHTRLPWRSASTPTKPPQLHQDEQGRVDAEMRERATAVSVYISGCVCVRVGLCVCVCVRRGG